METRIEAYGKGRMRERVALLRRLREAIKAGCVVEATDSLSPGVKGTSMQVWNKDVVVYRVRYGCALFACHEI